MLNLEQIVASFTLVGWRVTGLFLFAPFFGSASMPVRVKASFVLLLTWLLAPLVRATVPLTFGSLVTFSLRELAVGLVLGLSVQLVFESCQLAGQILGVQFGFSIVRVFDPQSLADSPVLAIYQQTIVLLLLFSFGIPELMLRSLARTYRFLPPGSLELGGSMVESLFHSAAGIFVCGVQIAAPALAITMLADIALGFLGRVSPQLPVLFIGLSVKTVLGMLVLAAALPGWPRWFADAFAASLLRGERMLGFAR